jgi:hypothetical protein
MILFGEGALRTALREFVTHFTASEIIKASAICSFCLIPISPTATRPSSRFGGERAYMQRGTRGGCFVFGGRHWNA